MEIALARSKELRLLHQEVLELREELDTQEVLERARNLLMKQHDFAEDEAVSRLRIASENTGKPMGVVTGRVFTLHTPLLLMLAH